MQFSPASYQPLVRTENVLSDKHRSPLLFPGHGSCSARRSVCAAEPEGRGSPPQGLAQGRPRLLLRSTVCFSAILLSLFLLKSSGGRKLGRTQIRTTATGIILVTLTDPTKIALTLMFLCTLVGEKTQLAPFPLSHPVCASLKQLAPADRTPLPTHGLCRRHLNRPFYAAARAAGRRRPSSSGLTQPRARRNLAIPDISSGSREQRHPSASPSQPSWASPWAAPCREDCVHISPSTYTQPCS